jgi:NAD(P)-dependent dehydrogenase (short-subunit alcohol dehydrogenase family)
MYDDLNGKVGVITGGNGRLAQTFYRSLGNRNRIYLVDVQSVPRDTAQAEFYRSLDITDEAAVRSTLEEILQKEGKIDFLVNNAALQITNSFERATVDEFRRCIDANLTGAYICIRSVADVMLRQGFGNIVNIGSMYGVVSADPNLYGTSGLNSPDSYAASKGGLIHLTRYLAANLAKYHIRVNALSPGGVFNGQPQEFLSRYTGKCPMGRMADREELVGPLAFLLSDASSYVTGHNLIVDGGFTLI